MLIAPWMDRISAKMRRLALEKLEIGSKDDLLEIGFGGGALIEAALARSSGRIVGVDVSEAAVARARRRLAGRAEIILGSAEKLPLEEASVDKAVSLNSLYFWADPGAAFREIARVLRPGGRLVLGFEPPEELAKWQGSRFGFRAWSRREVEAMLAAAGLTGFACTEGSGRRPDRFLILSAVKGHANG